jgi:hybrid cluster-associated redox disulfide protein
MEITKDTNIAEMIRDHPKTVEVLLKNGFGCIGCAIAHQESIGQGAKAHGLDDNKIDELIKELNKATK